MQSIICAFALHSYMLWYAMILLADSESPNQTARKRRQRHVFAWRGPFYCPFDIKCKGFFSFVFNPPLGRRTVWSSVCPSVCLSNVCPSDILFPDYNLSKCQWIFTKLGTCIDIVETWFGNANEQILSIIDRVICPQHDNGGVSSFHALFGV